MPSRFPQAAPGNRQNQPFRSGGINNTPAANPSFAGSGGERNPPLSNHQPESGVRRPYPNRRSSFRPGGNSRYQNNQPRGRGLRPQLPVNQGTIDDHEAGEPELETPAKKIPNVKPGDVRIIVLGGAEEIGKNMWAIEYGDDIVVIDIGLAFPGDEAPGVDYIIPDISYLEERKEKIRGVVITHGHLDHIGGIPYIMPKLGNPTIYTSLLAAVMIKKRQEEFTYMPKLNIQTVESSDVLRLGNLRVRFFETTHSIPDSLGVIFETPYGNVIFTGDIKIEHVSACR